jgi:hypothetical protein
MTDLGDDAYGWSRVLEHISTNRRKYDIKTALKFWKGQVGDAALMNYALDDARTSTDDDLLVDVDNGCIQITPLVGEEGVRVYTTKEVRIEGLSASATAIWADVNGWADVGRQMLFGPCPEPEHGYHEWNDSLAPSVLAPTAGYPGCDAPPKLPEGARGELVSQSVKLLADYVDDVSTRSADFADATYDRGVDLSGVRAFSADLGATMAAKPWQFIDAVVKTIGKNPPSSPKDSDEPTSGQAP